MCTFVIFVFIRDAEARGYEQSFSNYDAYGNPIMMAGTPSALWDGGPPGVGGPLSLISPYEAAPIAHLPHAPQAALRSLSLPERLLVQAATNRHRGGAAGAGALDVDRNHVDPLDEEVNVNVNLQDEALEEEVEKEVEQEEEQEVSVRRADTTECALGSPGSPRDFSRCRSAGRDDRMEHDAESPRVPRAAAEGLHRTLYAAADFRLASEHYRCAVSVSFANLQLIVAR